MESLGNDKTLDIREIYLRCFEQVFPLIENDQSYNQEISRGVEALAKSIERIESGAIERTVFHDRFVHYHLPQEISENNLKEALNVPAFNSPLTDEVILLPQARNYFDKEKIQLVSAETKKGWFYDLWYPGYMWAETPASWRAPGFKASDSTNVYYYGYQPLNHALEELNLKETGEGKWILSQPLSPFSTIKGRNFPVVLSFINNDEPAESKLKPDFVAELFAGAFSQAV